MSFWKPEIHAPSRPNVVEMATAGKQMAAPATEPPGTGPDEATLNLQTRILYIRSYLLMRAMVGFIGIGLPAVLVLGDGLLLNGSVTVRGSLSAYYYTGVRDVFVGALAAIAVFLVAYKIFEHSLNNVLSIVAGVAALTVAFFPTSRPVGGNFPLAPLQERLGEGNVSFVHYTASGVFIVALGIISFFFGVQEGRRSPQRVGRQARMSAGFWRWFHWTAAFLIAASVVFILVAKREHFLDQYSLLIGEVVAIVSFGISWLFKGLELDVLLGPGEARDRMPPELAVENP